MPSLVTFPALFPDRIPTWTDVAMALVALAGIPLYLGPNDPVSLPSAVFGFAAVVLLLGPVASTSVGRRVDRWGRETHPLVRAVLIVVLLVPFLAALRLADPPSAAVVGGFCGGMLGIAAFVFFHVLHAGEVSGWVGN